MNTVTFPANSVVASLLPLAAITSTANGAGLDIQKYKGTAMALLVAAAPSAGTNPTLAVKLQHAQDVNKVTSVSYAGTGNGSLEIECGPDPVAEDITITFSSATSAAVVGSVSGAIGTLTVGTRFESAQVRALVLAGSVAFVNNDAFTVPTTARTWSDLLSFTGLTSSAATEKKTFNIDKAGRFLRAVKTIGGTAGPSYAATLQLIASE